MKLLYKFFLPVISITVIVSVVVGYSISKQVKKNALKRAQFVTADYILAKATERLSTENFEDRDYARQFGVFESFMNLIKTKEIIKIKAFNANSDIIYSTSKKDIGQKTDSRNYKKALQGQIAADIKPPIEEQDNIDLLGYKQVMEVYVPISYDKKVQGVIETYYKMDFINDDIGEATRKILTFIAIFAIAILLSIYLVLKIVIVNPIAKLKEVSDEISSGNLDVRLPEIKTKDEIRDLNEALKGVFAAIEFLADEVKRRDAESKKG